ncbi:MAG: hypothetical protein RL264_2484 [Bacteroidota bacterium]|jgi:hypothetical protein
MTQRIDELLNTFDPIDLSRMDRVKLMNRVDTKFAFNFDFLLKILPLLKENYFLLEVENTRMPSYESLYFDDADFSFFHDHHKRKSDRFKVRIRRYVESDIYFFEVKHKTKGRTDKNRIKAKSFNDYSSQEFQKFIVEQLENNEKLEPKIWNKFHRLTFVNKTENERLTLDFDITFSVENKERKFRNLVIAELKQEKINRNSTFYRLMKEKMVRPYRLSKYCLGSIELFGEEQLKFNRFKKKLLHLKKIENNAA